MQLVQEEPIPFGLDLMKQVQDTRSRKLNQDRKSSNASIKSGQSSSVSHGNAKSAFKGSGASQNGQLMPKTAGPMKLTIQVKGHKQMMKLIQQKLTEILVDQNIYWTQNRVR